MDKILRIGARALAVSAILAAGALAFAEGIDEYDLAFDPGKYAVKSSVVNGKTVSYRAYEGIVYVRRPVDARFESLNFYVPAEYYQGKSVGGYAAQTAPIFFPNSVGGYMPGPAGSPGQDPMSGGPNAALVALSKGYVVAEPGARGRTNVGADGRYTGKAPACIIDLKAAVRYLRYNDKLMPGDAEKIVSNGTSAGGGLSALLGASGDSADYEPYLKALGAAEARDDIFAVSAYCPITNLENADSAYEWLFNGIDDYSKMVIQAPPAAPGNAGAAGPAGTMSPNAPDVTRTIVKGTISAEQIGYSAALKARFPAYVNGLGLKGSDGSALALNADGSGPFADYVKSFVAASAQKALDSGIDLSGLSWVRVVGGKVAGLDFGQYLRYVGRMKTPPAFDGLDLGNAENGLFGTASLDARHFTEFGQRNGAAGGELAEATVVKLMNPMSYIGASGARTAKYWRIRHGTADRDTSLAVPAILAARLANAGYSVDFATPWAVPHSGDYDLEELFAWMAGICR